MGRTAGISGATLRDTESGRNHWLIKEDGGSASCRLLVGIWSEVFVQRAVVNEPDAGSPPQRAETIPDQEPEIVEMLSESESFGRAFIAIRQPMIRCAET